LLIAQLGFTLLDPALFRSIALRIGKGLGTSTQDYSKQ
jgi:hypothetical protein